MFLMWLGEQITERGLGNGISLIIFCLLYTSDAADERSSVDLGGRRIIKKKKNVYIIRHRQHVERISHRTRDRITNTTERLKASYGSA